MTTKPCTVPRCDQPAAGFGTMCQLHRQTLRRHGHQQQAGTTVHQLAPYLRRVAARRAKNVDSTAWTLLEDRWRAIVKATTGTLQAYHAGRASVAHEVKAAGMVQALAAEASSTDVVNTALAMFLLEDAEPQRFRSDRAFRYQLVRRVRALAKVHAGSYWSHKEGRTRTVYRDTPPRVVEALAGALVEAFGLAGKMLADKERHEAERVTKDRAKLADALEALK